MIKIFANVCLVVMLAVGAMGNTLKTDVTYLPEDCHTKAASGDQVDPESRSPRKWSFMLDHADKVDRGQPLPFKLGAGQVISGWDQGIEGMCVGEKRVLTIPPELAYGEAGAGGVIPPGATLIFETELISVDK